MCTCGIDIATQQPNPAMASRVCIVRGVKAAMRSCSVPAIPVTRSTWSSFGPSRRSRSDSGRIVAALNRPMAR